MTASANSSPRRFRARVAADPKFQNARQNSDDANARIEHEKVLARIVTDMVKDDAELFKQFMDNEDFCCRASESDHFCTAIDCAHC